MEQLIGNKFEILKNLGEGGTGEVLLARDIHLNRLVAVKKIKKENEQREQARKEMEFLRELNHPNLPAVYDFWEEKEWLYLVMEYVEGITLEQFLKKNHKAEPEQTISWGIKLTEVLGYLHSRKPPVLYRDLKPGNIMIKPGGELKLIDLGACMKSVESGKQKGYVGTYGYAPSEQWRPGGISVRSDIYALGAVLHEMVTGMHPLEAGYERRPVREYDRSIPVSLEKVIAKCTAKEPEERYQTMEQVRDDLQANTIYKKTRKAFRSLGSLVITLFSFGGIVFWGYPLINGVPKEDFPFPYLYEPLFFMMVVVILKILLKGRTAFIKKIEKSILVTEKKFDGLHVMK